MHQAVQRAALHHAYPLTRGRMAGLGAPTGPSNTQVVQQVGSIANAATIGVLTATSNASIAAGGTGAILGMSPTLAMPIIGAAIMAVTLGIELILNSGCGQTCIIASNWANNAATLLEQNITAYFALPAPRTAEQKAQALANFQNIWNYLVQQCGSPQLGNAGVRCIQDRQAGACTWHQTGQPEFPGQPATGACWNWWNAFYDPINQDPAVVTQVTVGGTPTVGTGSTVTVPGIGSLSMPTVALIGAGLLMLLALGSN